MSSFTAGILAGVGASLLVAIGGGMFALRRFVLLRRRARHAERLAELGRSPVVWLTKSRIRCRRCN